MGRHSDGPWSVEKHAPFGWTIRAAREPHLGAGTLICQVQGYDAGADASLIGAAPKLLEALETLIAFVEDDTCRHDHEKAGPLSQARAAIAEARPSEPHGGAP